MQCSRCHGHMREIRQPGLDRRWLGKDKWLKQNHVSSEELERKLENLQSGWHETDAEHEPEVGTFFEMYRPILIISAATAVFSLTVLVALSVSIWNLGVLAVPFQGIFLVGFALSLGLPLKVRREYLMIKRGA